MIFRAPRVSRGQAITARVFNELAEAVDKGISGPKDLTEGLTSDEAESLSVSGGGLFLETTRVSETVRITNPEDEAQYVDVSRPRAITFIGSGGTLRLVFRA